MSHTALVILHWIAFGLAAMLLIVVLAFIAGVCICCVMRTRPNGYARRYRLPKKRTPARTLKITPERDDPQIIGDVSQARWPQGRYPASRPNIVRGEG